MKILNWTAVRALSIALTAMMTNAAMASDCAPGSFGGSEKSCDSGSFDCNGCDPCSRRSLYLGIEAVFLAPQYDGNGAATFGLQDMAGGGGVQIGGNGNSADRLTSAPRITLGWIGERGWGVQGRYWKMNNSVSSVDFPSFGAGNQIQPLGGIDAFEAYTIDLELTKQFSRGGWNMFGTLGARYADYDHSHTNSVAGSVSNGISNDAFLLGSFQNESFNGTGLTSSIAALRPFKRNPNLALFASARGSTLFGNAGTTAVAASSFGGTFGNANSVNGATDDSDETMFIGEFQTGLQWSRCTTALPGRFFARGAFEYQYWDTSNGNATAFATSGTAGSSSGSTYVTGGKQGFDLVGFSVMTGFAW